MTESVPRRRILSASSSSQVALEPFDVAVALEGEDVGGDAVEEPAVVADDDGAAGEVLDVGFEFYFCDLPSGFLIFSDELLARNLASQLHETVPRPVPQFSADLQLSELRNSLQLASPKQSHLGPPCVCACSALSQRKSARAVTIMIADSADASRMVDRTRTAWLL
jgi:hypothetical protein